MDVNYGCPVCDAELRPYGTGGMVCPQGHHCLINEAKRQAPSRVRVRSRRIVLRPWVPGAVLGGTALLIELVARVLGG